MEVPHTTLKIPNIYKPNNYKETYWILNYYYCFVSIFLVKIKIFAKFYNL